MLTTLDLSKMTFKPIIFSNSRQSIMTFSIDHIFHSHPPGNDHISPSKRQMWRWFSSSTGLVRYGFVPRRVHFTFLKARIFPYLSCWNADFPWGTQWERCVDFFQGSVAALIFFSGGDGGDANWKYLKEWLHRWWFQIYTLRIYFLLMGFITIFGEDFWICCPTTKQAKQRDVENVETSFRFQWCFDLCFFQRESWWDWAEDPGWFFSAISRIQQVGEIQWLDWTHADVDLFWYLV